MVGSALESGTRAAGHGQHEAVLAAAGRVLEIAPQCVAAQDMRVNYFSVYFGVKRAVRSSASAVILTLLCFFWGGGLFRFGFG